MFSISSYMFSVEGSVFLLTPHLQYILYSGLKIRTDYVLQRTFITQSIHPSIFTSTDKQRAHWHTIYCACCHWFWIPHYLSSSTTAGQNFTFYSANLHGNLKSTMFCGQSKMNTCYVLAKCPLFKEVFNMPVQCWLIIGDYVASEEICTERAFPFSSFSCLFDLEQCTSGGKSTQILYLSKSRNIK